VTSGGETRGTDLVVREAPLFNVSGVIVDSTPPSALRNYSVGFANRSGMAIRSAARDGTFTLRGLEPGEYTILAMVTGGEGPSRRGYRTVRISDSDLRIAVELGRSATLEGQVRFTDDAAGAFAGLTVALDPEADSGVSRNGQVDDNGRFRITDVAEGGYTFQLFGRESEVYLKQARCAGADYTKAPIQIAADQTVDDCTIELARDTGQVSGRVLKEGVPQEGMIVVLIPQEPERRRIARHTSLSQTDKSGMFQIRGVVPGEYFAFAVLPMDDAGYYDTEFAGRNRESAERLTVKPREQHTLELKPTQPR